MKQQFASAPLLFDMESELRQLLETVAQLKWQKTSPRFHSNLLGRIADVKPISTRQWWQGGQTRSRGSAISCASTARNDKFLLFSFGTPFAMVMYAMWTVNKKSLNETAS